MLIRQFIVMFGQFDNAILVSVPVYVILGHQDEHLGLMIAMEEMKLFDNGEVKISPSNLFNNVVIIIIIIIIIISYTCSSLVFLVFVKQKVFYNIYIYIYIYTYN